MTDPLNDFEDSDNPYTLRDRVGSFGTFRTSGSLPLEYIQITFTAEELDFLTLARDLKSTQERNFDLLLQRDIDEEKVEKAKEYLTTENNRADRTLFFPPLLAAILPFSNNEMGQYYSDEEGIVEGSRVRRTWKDEFSVEYVKGDGAQAYLVPVTQSSVGNTVSVEVRRAMARLNARILKVDSIGKGVRLVVIDGQHRLETLRRVGEDDPQLLAGMQIPVCVIYPPHATSYHSKKAGVAGAKIPEVKDTFRKLFLDVNSKSDSVSGHFKALLNDTAAHGLAVRKFCDFIVQNKGAEALAAIEWNVRKDKESKEISRFYSLTSIGILAPILEKILDDYGYYLLNIVDLQQKLGGTDQDFDLRSLTYAQKKPIEDSLLKNVIPLLESVFFKTEEYVRLLDGFKQQLAWLDKECATASGTEKQRYSKYKASIVDYRPTPKKNRDLSDGIDAVRADFAIKIGNVYAQEDGLPPIVQKAIFQKGMFEALYSLLDIGKEFNIDPAKLGDAFAGLLNEALKQRAVAFHPTRAYLQNLLFDKTAVLQNLNAHRSVGNLILAFLGRKDVALSFANYLSQDEELIAQVSTRLTLTGQGRAAKLIEQFEAQSKRVFVRGYKTDLSLSPKERQEFEELQRVRDKDKIRAKNKEIPSNKIDGRFDLKVTEKLQSVVERARQELQARLAYTAEIVIDQGDEGDLALPSEIGDE